MEQIKSANEFLKHFYGKKLKELKIVTYSISAPLVMDILLRSSSKKTIIIANKISITSMMALSNMIEECKESKRRIGHRNIYLGIHEDVHAKIYLTKYFAIYGSINFTYTALKNFNNETCYLVRYSEREYKELHKMVNAIYEESIPLEKYITKMKDLNDTDKCVMDMMSLFLT